MATATAPLRLNLNLGPRGVNKKISPTYISSDLHSPNQKGRSTIPSIGQQRAEAKVYGGKTWGENVTNYGGIGKLSFLGKRRARDLFVSRNQKHFSSGLSTYETDAQPYMLTAFKYSGCRQNDQVLPPCFKIGLNPYEMIVFDGSPIIPYFSHKPKHEVYPRNDPDRRTKDGSPALTERTRKALHDYYKYLYETDFYSTSYPNHMPETQSQSTKFSDVKSESKITKPFRVIDDSSSYSKMIPLLAQLCLLSNDETKCTDVTPLMGLLYSYVNDLTTCFSMDAYEEFYKVIKALHMFLGSSSAKDLGVCLHDFHLNTMINILEDYGTIDEKVLKLRKVIYEIPNCSIRKTTATQPANGCFSQAPTMVCENVRNMNKCVKEIPGVSPCWPPSTSYTLNTRTMQLKSTGSLPQGETTALVSNDKCSNNYINNNQHCLQRQLPKLSKRRAASARRLDISPIAHDQSVTIREASLDGSGLPEYKKFIGSILPVSFDDRGLVIDQLRDVPAMIIPTAKPEFEKKDFSAMDKWGRNTYLPPISLSECLPADGNRIQDRLGLQFKSEAHKRFHAMYPDDVPDLRDNINYRKRYFFNGFHASAFR